ncbi:hypothetical protein Mapa_009642 [Marchantia paleacea]|nr:hypothetical protein Mapa_009642 [Marchantia paleacea]
MQIRWEEQGEMVKEVELMHKEGKDFQLREVVRTMTTNVICRMTLGKPYYGKNVVKTQDLLEFQNLMLDMVITAGKPNITDLIPALRWLDPQGLTAEFKELHRRQERVMRTLLEEHKQARAESKGKLLSRKTMDFVDVLLSLEGEDKLSDTCIMGTISDMFLGATDSTSVTCQWALIELIRNPDKMAKLQKELDEVVGKDRPMSEADLPELPYLEAVIKETLRLHPTVPLLFPRMNDKQTILRGYDIPKNSSVFVNIWAISRDPKLWDDAEIFKPERFLTSPIHVVGNHFQYTPFGAGRRQCVGVTMGMLMAERTLGCLVHCFDFRPPQGKTISDVSIEDEFGLVLQPKHPLMCGAVPRLPSVGVYYDPQYKPV